MNTTISNRIQTVFLSAALSVGMFFSSQAADIKGKLSGKKISIAAFLQTESLKPYEKTIQAYLESAFRDNKITVLDEQQTSEMKNIWKKLEDPGYVVKAEDFVNNAGKYDVEAVVRIYVSGDVVPGLASYFTATAQADMRLVWADARVDAAISKGMGTPGKPPSDGLTKDSAMINALQRAVHECVSDVGLESIPPIPGIIQLSLSGPVGAPGGGAPQPCGENDASLNRFASLDSKTWTKESVTCSVKSPDGGMGVVASYIEDTDFHRRPPRMFGARLHVVNLKLGRTANTFDFYKVEKKGMDEKGDRKIFACAFLGNWRYLAAVSGSHLCLWDTELGKELSRLNLGRGVSSANLQLLKSDSGAYVVVQAGGNTLAFKVEIRR